MELEYEIMVFENDNQERPFDEWLLSLDSIVRRRILTRLTRLTLGHFGDCKSIGHNLFELRFFFGSGYRIYFGKDQEYIIILLCGGDKDSQNKDIYKAKQYWGQFHERKNKKNKPIQKF